MYVLLAASTLPGLRQVRNGKMRMVISVNIYYKNHKRTDLHTAPRRSCSSKARTLLTQYTAIRERGTVIVETLHVPTLVAINTILVFVAVAVNLVVLKWNPEVPGVRYWAIGNLLNASGLLLIFSRGVLSPFLSIVCANTSIVGGFYTIYLGFRVHRGKAGVTDKKILLPFLLFLLLFAAVFAYLTYIEKSLNLRISLVSLALAIICSLLAFEVAGIPHRSHLLTRGFAALIALNAAFNLIRAVVTMAVPDSRVLLEGGGMARLVFMESSVAIFVFTVGYILIISDHLLEQLRQQAEIDHLTNVFNSRSFIRLVKKARAAARRNDSPLSLISIDLDRFKQVNDTYGHAAGDAVLRHFSSTITRSLRPGDTLGRMGGEEFMVLLPDTEIPEAVEVAERLRLKIEGAIVEFEEVHVTLTISLGVAGDLRGEKAFDQLAKESDIALYKAKRQGRNRVAVFEEEEDHGIIAGWTGRGGTPP